MDGVTGETVSAFAQPGDVWYGPGLLADGSPAYDTHGWMHQFQFMDPGMAGSACSRLEYTARLVVKASSLPLALYSVRVASLRDCDNEYCGNFTGYGDGDVIVRLVREHRVGADLSVATDDDLPVARHGSAADAEVPEGRNVTAVFYVRQPILLPPAYVFEPQFEAAAATLAGEPCETPTCWTDSLSPRPDLANSLAPWSAHVCWAVCNATQGAALFTLSLPVADAGGALVSRYPLTFGYALNATGGNAHLLVARSLAAAPETTAAYARAPSFPLQAAAARQAPPPPALTSSFPAAAAAGVLAIGVAGWAGAVALRQTAPTHFVKKQTSPSAPPPAADTSTKLKL